MATGVNQGRSGTLCFWLLECINAVSGNLDRQGGTLMGRGLFDMAAEVTKDPQMMVQPRSRATAFPTVSGQQPAGMLADDILERPRHACWSSRRAIRCSPAANPSGRLDRALAKLELLVSIDLFRNEIGSLAHYVLPATTWLERPEIPYALQSFAGCTPTPYMIYADAVLEPPPGVRPEWWMFARLADELGVTLFGNRLASGGGEARGAARPTRARPLRSTSRTGSSTACCGAGKPARPQGDGARAPARPPAAASSDGGDFLGSERVLKPDRQDRARAARRSSRASTRRPTRCTRTSSRTPTASS